MRKLEKSIRHELVPFGPALRNHHYSALGQAVGCISDSHKTFSSAHYDYDKESGIVTSIRIYGIGDAKEPRDYHRETDISEPIEAYLCNLLLWDEMVEKIAEIVRGDFQ